MISKYTNFIAIDVETTGLESDSEIIEVGLVVVENGKLSRQWQSLVKPQASIPKEISAMTGITNAMVKNAPRWKEIENELLEILDTHLLIAHNYTFDKGRIEFELGYALKNDWLDSHDMAKLFLPTLSSYKLASIATHLQIADNEHHRALNDAIVCANVFLKILDDARHLSPLTLSDMASTYGNPQESLFTSNEHSLGELLYTLANHSTEIGSEEPLEFPTDNFCEALEPLLTFDEAENFFKPDGILAQNKPDYQYRSQQTEMLNCIKQAFLEKKHALIEAGTGTGKSFAYLVPALLWSYETNQRVIVATGTINLQEQLFHTDLPFLKKVLNFPFATAITKGRGNYLCLRRFEEYCRHASDASERERIFATSLVLWRSMNASGDKEYLNLNKAELQYWQNIASAADTCLGRRCHHYQDCCFFNNRRQCEQSRVIITNHSLLFQDLRLNGLLSEHNHVIIDEAHHLEDEATHQFTDTIDYELIRKLLNGFTRSGGFLSRTSVILNKSKNIPDNLNEIVLSLSRTKEDNLEAIEIFLQCARAANEIPELANIGDLRLTDKIRNSEWWIILEEALRKSHRALITAVTSINRLLNHLEDDEELESLIREMTHSRDRLSEQQKWLERFIAGIDDDFVYWIKTYQNSNYCNLLLNAAYIDIMPLINEKLFKNNDTVILTSATLAINKHIDYTAEKFLLQPNEYVDYISDAPFNYEEQSLIAIPNNHKDYSKTNDFEYTKNVISDLKKLIPAVDGDMLVLFTSYSMLNRVQQALKNEPSLKKYKILAHGQDGTRTSLLEALQNNSNTVLLGANSFWEGVDIKGKNLRTVVIAKLPFIPPTMPIESARNELIQSNGKNAFTSNSLPQAVLRFRQGCGRLIRSNTDHGCIIVLDNRIITKNYGKTFLNSLPTQPVWIDNIDNLAIRLKDWHTK